jgi:hypothetical protein
VPSEPRVFVVDDEDDDPHLYHQVEERASVPGGVIVVRPVPGVTNLRQMAIEVLIALGKHYDALARERQGARAWRLAWLWVRAEQIRHVVVFDAQRLPPPLWHQLVTAAAEAGSRLWLITRSHVDGHGLPVGAGRCTPGDLLAQLPSPIDAPAPGSPYRGGWLLPQDNFLTFRARCKDLLSRERFAEIDAIYLDTFRATRRWLADQDPRRLRQETSRDDVAQQLRILTVDSRSPEETTVRVRAAQAACFVSGLLIQAAETCTGRPADVPTLGFNYHVSARVRRLVTPELTSGLAIAGIAQLTVAQLHRLNIGDIAVRGDEMTVGDVDIPGHATALIRVQLLERRQLGAESRDPLFGGRDGGRRQVATLRRRLDDARQLAAIWQTSGLRRPPWQQPPATGYNIDVVALADPVLELVATWT